MRYYQPATEPKSPPTIRYLVGLDLGQANDYTALIVANPTTLDEPNWDVYVIRHIERVPLKSRYPDIVAHVGKITDALLRPQLQTEPDPDPRRPPGSILITGDAHPEVTLIVDYTGVGRPVFDMILEAQIAGTIDEQVQIVPVTITGADRVHVVDGEVRVPKRDLASVVQRLLQEQRLRIPRQHAMAPVLTEELTGFRVKISASGRDSYGAGEDWRSAAHDDLVLALALALWFGERTSEAGI